MKNKVTIAKPQKSNNGNICTVTQEIKNKLNEIITETLAEQEIVLKKRKKDLKTWQLEEKKEFLIIFGRDEDSARDWMLKGVDAMIAINKSITYKDFKYDNSECVFAHVNDIIDDNNKIIIGPKFLNAALRGSDSRVSVLCHEFSHLGEVMNTKDIAPTGKNETDTTSEEYVLRATDLVNTHSRDVMNNAYNIERYFE
ncbi:M35 family metallo-endopeptidase [Citrobacter cronae]|uniref:M35 family metallo-endopeptidase n=1 Tax=Citrobacter cronae TaxID=1748967 RepID=UPI0021CDFD22|nr:M35 family metallo-endopeptidase [Citrobacter cronae]MCU6174640.1 peptidase M35 [Citrobacter cronae]